MSSSKSANPSSQLTPTGGPTIIPNPPPNTLRHPVRFITTHNHTTGQAILHSSTPVPFRLYDNNNLSMGVAYTTSSFPPNLNSDADITAHTSLMSSGTLGLVNPGGTVLRCVDFAPGYACGMHRTQSLDFGIVIEGEVEMVLDSGERYVLKRGDVAVQRATQHQWVNRSQTEWARMMFVLQDCEEVVVGGKVYGEDLGTNSGLPPSGNSGVGESV